MILLLGGTGLLGHYVHAELLLRGMDVEAPPHSQLDLSVQDIDYYDAIINCAGITSVDACNRSPQDAYVVNGHVNRALAECSNYILYISTVSVLNSDTVYARSKRVGEDIVMEAGGMVVRTTRLFGYHPRSFTTGILKDARACRIVRGSTRVFTPTYAGDLAVAICDAVERRTREICTIHNSGSCTYYEFIRYLLDMNGYMDTPIELVEDSTPVELYDSDISLRTWQEALDDVSN